MTKEIRSVLKWSPWCVVPLAFVACVTGLLTGKADHVGEMTYGVPHPIVRVGSAGTANRLAWDIGSVRPWRFTRTPQGRHAAVSLADDGQLVMMLDIDGDPRYFVVLIQNAACSGGTLQGATLETMRPGDYRQHDIRPETGPWFRRQLRAECSRSDGAGHVHATPGAVMQWFMRVLPGQDYRLRTDGGGDVPQQTALDLVMGSGTGEMTRRP